MKYSEVFHSIQGEGKLVGTPSVFFRTSYCDLRCVWCDSAYTSWVPENKEISVEDALSEICAFSCHHVVITGGEPFLWTKELALLTYKLMLKGKHITIETNGRHYYPEVFCDLLSISPKLSNSTPPGPKWAARHNRLRINPDALKNLFNTYHYQLKFVIDQPPDLTEVQNIVHHFKVSADNVYLMPQGIKPEEVHPKLVWLAEICKQHGYKLSPRLHLDIYGNQRGT